MRVRHFLKRLGVFFLMYATACATLMVNERSMVYQPRSGPVTPQEVQLSGYERQVVTAADGAQIPYWEHDADAPTLLYFHGNGGGLYMFTKPLEFFAAQHFHVIAMEYRGYPSAPPGPSEEALIADALALYDTVRARYPDRPIIAWGYSLGSGIAVPLAAKRPVDALVLEAPFSATVDRAAQLFPWAPVHLLMRDQYRSREVIGQVRAPLFIMHGDADRIIPIALGRALYERANAPKTFREYPGAGHLDLMHTSAYGDAVAFIGSAVSVTQP